MKDFKLIKIDLVGDHSVKGTIITMYNIDVYQNINENDWIIMIDLNDSESVIEECKTIGIENYILVDKDTAKWN